MRKAARNQINYSEGTCFFLPLRKGGFSRGVVARVSRDGPMFAYFFGPKLDKPEGSFDDVRSEEALLLGLCGDLGLLNGKWKIAGKLKGWNRVDWRLPPLYHEDPESQQAWLTYYDDDNLKFIREEPVQFGVAHYSNYPYDRLMGYGSVEIRMTKLLSQM